MTGTTQRQMPKRRSQTPQQRANSSRIIPIPKRTPQLHILQPQPPLIRQQPLQKIHTMRDIQLQHPQPRRQRLLRRRRSVLEPLDIRKRQPLQLRMPADDPGKFGKRGEGARAELEVDERREPAGEGVQRRWAHLGLDPGKAERGDGVIRAQPR